MKILVVEDETTVREGIVSILNSYLAVPHKLKSCACSTRAIVVCKDFHPDLVITDIVMPNMNGLEMIEKLKEKKLASSFIILSGHDNFQYAQQAIRHGVAEYLLKPIDRELLLDAVCKCYRSLHSASADTGVLKPFIDLPYFSWELNLSEMPSALQRIIRYMHKNYMKDITQQSISEELFFHTSYISSLINKYTGHNFSYLLDYIRIRNSVELLLSDPDMSIAEISVLVGYQNERRIYAAFRKRLNMSPGELRKLYL